MADSEYEESHVPDMLNERWGGPQGAQDDESDEDEDAAFKREERERKKADVRRRLEAVGRAKNVKRGFLTPERKKKLKQLLMAKAAEDLKQQQLMKEQERQRILNERIPDMPNIDDIDNKGELEKILKEMWDQLMDLEDVKYDLDIGVRQKDFEINELTIQVNDLRGKFVKPTLKKVKQFDSKFEKLQSTGTKKVDFRSTLNTVEKDKYAIEEVEKDKPAWA